MPYMIYLASTSRAFVYFPATLLGSSLADNITQTLERINAVHTSLQTLNTPTVSHRSAEPLYPETPWTIPQRQPRHARGYCRHAGTRQAESSNTLRHTFSQIYCMVSIARATHKVASQVNAVQTQCCRYLGIAGEDDLITS